MGKYVLAYQFTAGLLPHLKAHIAGREGTFEELLTRAKFEEAWYRDIVEAGVTVNKPVSAGHMTVTGQNNLTYRSAEIWKQKVTRVFVMFPLWGHRSFNSRLPI